MLNTDLPPAEWFTGESPGYLREQLVRSVEHANVVAIDSETTGLSVMTDQVLYWSLSWREDHRIRRACLRRDVLPDFVKLFGQTDKRWTFANAKFDAHMFANTGFHIKGELADTQVMHGLLYEEAPHGLKEMTKQIFDWVWADFTTTFGKTNPSDPLDTIQRRLIRAEKECLSKLVEYASNDAFGTLRLYEELGWQLRRTNTWSIYPDEIPTLWEYFERFELPFTRVLWSCEREGIGIDLEQLEQTQKLVSKEEERVQRELNREAGRPLNPNNADQLIEFFFTYRGNSPNKFTKGGSKGVRKPAVDADVLKKLADKGDRVAALVIEKKELANLRTTFLGGIRKGLDRYGRVHTRYNQARAVTGRLSSADPNLQNVKHSDKDRFHIRKIFVAHPGNKLVVADYEALEMMLLAEASGDPGMLSIFDRGWDIHMGNASLVFGYPYEDIKKAKLTEKLVKESKLPESDMTAYFKKCLQARQYVKVISYGLNYGMKETKLALALGITPEEAVKLTEQYMARYPAVKQFFNETQRHLELHGCVYTMCGRRRSLPEIGSPLEFERWRAGRQAANFVIQGSAAECARGAMNRLFYEGAGSKYGYSLLSQVHDELIGEVPEETAEQAAEMVKECMGRPLMRPTRVPLRGSPTIARSWHEAK